MLFTFFALGCSDPSTAPCTGFSAEPYINVNGDGKDSFGIYYINAESFGDTLFTNSGKLQIPVDPSNGQMFYEIIADTSLGTFNINYNLWINVFTQSFLSSSLRKRVALSIYDKA